MSRLTLALLAMTFLSLSAHSQTTHVASPPATTVVTIDYTKGTQVVSVNGEPIVKARILFKLSELKKRVPDNSAAIVLASEKTSIYDILSMRVALMKAGFNTIRYLCFDKDKSSMFELKFLPPVPFSTSSIPVGTN